MEITAAIVKELRDRTGAGMMDCKKALNENNGDMELAIEYLRKKGAATAEKRADRTANEGVVVTSIENGNGIIVEVNCETDFVARSEDFLSFANRVLESSDMPRIPPTSPALLQQKSDDLLIEDHLQGLIGKVGEKIEVKRFSTFKTDGTLIDYIHPGAKLGVMLEISGATGDAVATLGKDLAMQVAAMSPVAIDRSSVPDDVKEKELSIYRQQALEQGKPENMVDRIAEGKLNKYFQEYTLLEQTFLRDTTKTVKEHVEQVGKQRRRHTDRRPFRALPGRSVISRIRMIKGLLAIRARRLFCMRRRFMEPKYKRILLKLSGESLMGDREYGIDPDTLRIYADEIISARELGVQIGIVLGGGNIYRGVVGCCAGYSQGLGRSDGHARHHDQLAGPAEHAGRTRRVHPPRQRHRNESDRRALHPPPHHPPPRKRPRGDHGRREPATRTLPPIPPQRCEPSRSKPTSSSRAPAWTACTTATRKRIRTLSAFRRSTTSTCCRKISASWI
jgi:elongation factor Ts